MDQAHRHLAQTRLTAIAPAAPLAEEVCGHPPDLLPRLAQAGMVVDRQAVIEGDDPGPAFAGQGALAQDADQIRGGGGAGRDHGGDAGQVEDAGEGPPSRRRLGIGVEGQAVEGQAGLGQGGAPADLAGLAGKGTALGIGLGVDGEEGDAAMPLADEGLGRLPTATLVIEGDHVGVEGILVPGVVGRPRRAAIDAPGRAIRAATMEVEEAGQGAEPSATPTIDGVAALQDQ